jgi:hypothetical protein
MFCSTRLLFAWEYLEGHPYVELKCKGTSFNVLCLLYPVNQAHCSSWSLHCLLGFSTILSPTIAFILGALPLFAYSINKKKPLGLKSFINMICSRITNYDSLSSSFVHYIKFLHDVMCNKALCHSDSLNVTDCGFVVDAKILTGLSIWNKGETTLSNSTDSHQMVCSLSASKEYIKYDMFLTFTCAQKDLPGRSNLFQLKFFKEWAHYIPDYFSVSEIKQNEFAQSMEELYGLISFCNWMESWELMLNFIYNGISSHGACTCIFSRTEYQKDLGNFPHEHTILALKKDTLKSLTTNQLNNLIATNVMEIVQPEDFLSLFMTVFCHILRISMTSLNMVGGRWSILMVKGVWLWLVLAMAHKN